MTAVPKRERQYCASVTVKDSAMYSDVMITVPEIENPPVVDMSLAFSISKFKALKPCE